ncbi:MAG TPA: LptF/LptG family permease [Gemmatimonadaceae bacterium]|nr:LptF/LptG family permease [Gemmatimonadaceae bacterium]
MKILTRYILREHAGPLIFALSALTSLLLLNQIAKQFGNLVGKGLSWAVILEFFLLSIPFIVAMTLPMAVLVATLYAFSRLSAENEITALKSTGVSILRLIRPVLWGGAVLTLLMFAFNDQVLPRSNQQLSALQTAIARKKPTFALREQVINEISPGKLFLRANHIDEATNGLREVTIYDLSNPQRRRTVYADSGVIAMSENRRDLQMTLYNGLSQELPKDSPGELQRLFFAVDLLKVRGVGNQLERTANDNFKSDREMSICEMAAATARSERDMATSQTSLADAMGNAALTLASGQVRIHPTPPDTSPSFSLVGLYCRQVLPMLGVKQAHAADVPPGPPLPQRATLQRPEATKDPDDTVTLRVQTPDPGARVTRGALPAALSRDELGVEGSNPFTTMAELEVIRARIVDSRQSASRYLVEIHKKLALSAACVVFVLLGAPIALRFPRGGVGLVIGVSLGVFALYYVGLIAGESLADRLILSPFGAMWAANVLFTIVGLFLLRRARKVGTSLRGGMDPAEMFDALRMRFKRTSDRVTVPQLRRRREA